MPAPASLPAELPESFFRDLDAATRPDPQLPPAPVGQWQPTKAMYWYDSIIDDMLANPGTSIKETAARLGRHAVTISLIVRSDLFKARYSQRRAAFNEDLDQRLTGKLAKIAEKSLDLTLQVLETKQDKVPLPQLVEIQNKALDRLGYGTATAASPSVHITNNVAAVPTSVSPEALEDARRKLRLIEATKLEAREAMPVASVARELGEESEGAS